MRKQPSCFLTGLSFALAASFAGMAPVAADEAKQEATEKTSPHAGPRPSDDEGSGDEQVDLLFRLKVDRKVYIQSDWGQPPQLAIWLESVSRNVVRRTSKSVAMRESTDLEVRRTPGIAPKSDFGTRSEQSNAHKIKTLWVTHRTGAGEWEGKADCPVSLPYWVSRYNKETKTTGPPTFQHPAADAITQPTPKDEFRATTTVPRGSTWDYFVEVNVSGDFNCHFPSIQDDGVEDPQGNGQPSLIYQGRITAKIGARSSPKLIGRTDQFEPVDHIIQDLKGVTSAKQILPVIDISCTATASIDKSPLESVDTGTVGRLREN